MSSPRGFCAGGIGGSGIPPGGRGDGVGTGARVTGSEGEGRSAVLRRGGEAGGEEEGERGGEAGGERRAPADRSDTFEEEDMECVDEADGLRERGGDEASDAIERPEEVRESALLGGGDEPKRREREKRERCRVLR